MRVEIKDLHRDLKITSIYVTHDQVEAMTLADRLVVMNAGRIEQVGTPAELYSKPATRFVASFLGSPSMSFLAAGDMELESGYRHALEAADAIGLRPENLSVVAGEGMGRVRGRIELVENLGGDHVIYVRLPSGSRIVARVSSRDWQRLVTAGPTEEIFLQFDPRDLHLFDSKARRIEMYEPENRH